MSETVTLAAGDVFSGGTTTVAGDTGTIALTQVGTVEFSGGPNPTISNVTITQDAAASSVSYDGVFIESVRIDSVTSGATVTLTTNDLPPNVSLPSGFSLPDTVTGTTLDVTVTTNRGDVTGIGQVGVYGYSGNQVLVGVENLTVDGLSVNVGAAILSLSTSLGVQGTGTVDDSFSPAFTQTAPCFAAGTLIRTRAGERPVEALAAGDTVLLADGGTETVQWVGHRRVDCHDHPHPMDVRPVRIVAGAFAPGQPARDLNLSPDHAVLVDGVLIPVRYLLNGATVRQEDVAAVTYYHVELSRHAVLLAEGLPAESYLDTGNRAAFANGGTEVMLHPDFAADHAMAVWQAQSCAPLALEGAAVDEVRARLAQRAAALGWRQATAPALELIVDAGGADAQAASDRVIHVALPATARTVRLRSRSFVPATLDPATGDWRRLGAPIGVTLDGAPLAAPCFAAGWHPAERDAIWRWTDGEAVLALPVLTGPATLTLELFDAGARYWVAAAA